MTKKNDPLIAVIDLGTTGNRSIIFDLKGQELVKAYREFPTITDEPEQAEQDAEDWWRTTKVTMKEAISHEKIDPKNIIAVTVVTQRATLVPLDKKGTPLARAITWMDVRISPSAKKLEELVKQRTSVRRALWFKDMQPKVFKQTNQFATPDAFLYHQLTDKLTSDLTNHNYGLLDQETLSLSEKLGEELELPISMWPDLVSSGTVIGEVTKEAAKQTGLPPDIPVVVGGGDQQCSTVGLGVIQQGVAKITTGTGTFVVTPVDKITKDPMGVLFCNPHVIPNQWVLEGVVPGTGTILRWFRDQFGYVERAVAERLGRDPYDYIVEEAGQAPAGSDGLVLFPFLIFGIGLLQGMGFQHTRAHIARAILEGVAYVPRFLLDTMFSAGVTIDKLRLDGGGARSALWRQIHCDVTNRPCTLTGVDEGTALGAAILAAVGLKMYPSIQKAVSVMVHQREVHTPNPDNLEIYNQMYSKFQTILMNNLQELLKHV